MEQDSLKILNYFTTKSLTSEVVGDYAAFLLD